MPLSQKVQVTGVLLLAFRHVFSLLTRKGCGTDGHECSALAASVIRLAIIVQEIYTLAFTNIDTNRKHTLFPSFDASELLIA